MRNISMADAVFHAVYHLECDQGEWDELCEAETTLLYLLDNGSEDTESIKAAIKALRESALKCGFVAGYEYKKTYLEGA